MITVLLNTTGIELATKKDAELEVELSAAGVANIFTGLLGGIPGYLSISRSVLNYKAGGRTRLSGLTAAACCTAVFLFGSSLMTLFPKLILGGLLLYLGFLLLKEWLVDSWFSLSHLDYTLVAGIMLVIASWGFLEGVGHWSDYFCSTLRRQLQ